LNEKFVIYPIFLSDALMMIIVESLMYSTLFSAINVIGPGIIE